MEPRAQLACGEQDHVVSTYLNLNPKGVGTAQEFMHVCTYTVCTHLSMCVYVCAYMYMYIYIHIYTAHTHTYTYSFRYLFVHVDGKGIGGAHRRSAEGAFKEAINLTKP